MNSRPRSLRSRLGIPVVLGLLLSLFAAPVADQLTAEPASALSGSEFQAGHIISDALFYDGAAMSAAEIQAFLDDKIGTCLNGRCLNVAQVTTQSYPSWTSPSTGELACAAVTGGTMSAAEWIYRVQTACGISAKVILVTMQKEQGLTTSRAPGDWALLHAMGMACPDTAPCSSAFAGLATQIYTGTEQLKLYKAARFGKQPGVNFIQWSPNASCGGSYITIQNYATAALYNYTPYQPNSAALANLYGSGDGCSAYGNRNFWRFYNDWFGSTYGTVPFNTLGPWLAGPSTLGATLTAQGGTWSGQPSFSYAWYRCETRPADRFENLPGDCTQLPGLAGVTYVTTEQDLGKHIAVVVTGANGWGSRAVGAVMDGPVGKPFNTVAPTLTGDSEIGSTWTVDIGTWTGSPEPEMAIYWLRCDQPVSAPYTTVPSWCQIIPGARSVVYVSTSADSGKYLTAQVAGNSPLGFSIAGPVNTIMMGFPTNTVAPSVSGSSTIGSTWTVDVGTWIGSPAPQIVIYWLRCNQPVSQPYTTIPSWCQIIPGANSASYVSTASDSGKYLTAQVAGNSPLGFTLAGPVNTTMMGFPANTTPPELSGAPTVGSNWTVDAGAWTGTPTPTLAIYWLRCEAPIVAEYTTVPAGCSVIPGARSRTYTATTADVGMYLTAQVAGNNTLGFSIAGAKNSIAIEAVAKPVNSVAPVVSGAATVGSTLVADPGTWTGSPTFAIAWLRCDAAVGSTFTTVPSGCAVISLGSATSYVLTAADAGKYVTVQVAGNSPSGFTLAGVPTTSRVAA